jgi:hypothetical protein
MECTTRFTTLKVPNPPLFFNMTGCFTVAALD